MARGTEAARRRRARSFYACVLSEAERASMPVALEVEGIDQEIAMLRLRLRAALEGRPQDLALMLRGVETLRKLVAVKYGLTKEEQREMSPYVEETLRRIEERGEGKANTGARAGE